MSRARRRSWLSAVAARAASPEAAPSANTAAWPKIWTNFNWGGDLPAQFADMAAHGIDLFQSAVTAAHTGCHDHKNRFFCHVAFLLCFLMQYHYTRCGHRKQEQPKK